MQPLKNSITSQQQANIRKHVNFLCFDPRPNKAGMFEMYTYGTPECGTPGCSEGWARVSLGRRCTIAFGAGILTGQAFGIELSKRSYYWCFCGGWENDPVTAAARLLYLLEYGIPDKFNGVTISTYPNRMIVWIEKVRKIQEDYFKKIGVA